MDNDESYPKELILKDGEDEYEIKILKRNAKNKNISEESESKTEENVLVRALHSLGDIIDEIYGYFPLIGYTIVFTLFSLLNDIQNLYCLYFASLSVLVLLNEEARKHHKFKSSIRMNNFLTLGFVCVIVVLFLFRENCQTEMLGIISNVVSGIVLLLTINFSVWDILKDANVLNNCDSEL